VVYFNVTYGGSISNNDDVTCRVDLLNAEGSSVARTIIDEGNDGFIGKIDVPDAKLWWPYLMDPNPGYLYKLEVR
jgi:beta-glucuronidase